MDRDDFLAVVEETRHSHPNWFDLRPDEAADSARIAEIESRLGAHLPEHFRWFLQEFGGGDFAFAAIYSADPSSDLYLLANQPSQTNEMVAFSDDGTGNLFVFPVKDGACQDRVLLLDHESGGVRPTAYGDFLRFIVSVGLRAGV